MGGIGVSYFQIEKDGSVPNINVPLSDAAREACELFRVLYASTGFVEPWIGYLGVSGGEVVCACGFKSPPRDGVVEIGYATFPLHGGIGIGDLTVRGWIHMAYSIDPTLAVEAYTAPEENASVAILRKYGFIHVATIEDADNGTTWRWLLPSKIP